MSKKRTKTQSNENVLGTSFDKLLEDKESRDLVDAQLEALESFDEVAESSFADAPERNERADNATGIDEEQETNDRLGTETDSPDTDSFQVAEPFAPKVVEIDDVSVVHGFLQEVREHLDNAEEKILQLENESDSAAVDEVFRAMHTIKGTSGFFDFRSIMELSHALESVLDDIRNGSSSPRPALTDVLLAGADELRKLVDDIDHSLSDHAEEAAPIHIEESKRDIRPFLGRIRSVNDVTETEVGQEQQASASISSEAVITDDVLESFAVEALDLISDAQNEVLALEENPEDSDRVSQTFRHVHTLKGNAGFLGLRMIESACARLEDVLEVLAKGERTPNQAVISAILVAFDSLEKTVKRVRAHGQEEADNSAEEEQEDTEHKPLGSILVEMGFTDEESVDQALDLQGRKVGEILVEKGVVTEENLGKALAEQKKLQPQNKSEGAAGQSHIRVEVGKLDRLFDLTGELITAESMVVHNPDLQGKELERFNRAAEYLGKITRQMQEITMSVRMIPLAGMFNKMRRVVRDLSRRMDKSVELHISGQDTEMDRNVMEELSDPLVHILRNAVDHGIEPAEKRREAGKIPEGQLHLTAWHEGSEIWIQVSDDGSGLDRDAIIQKAVSRDLITEDEAAALSDGQVGQLIFEPGFSTAAQLSDVSGRGVGMDVVKRNIEKLRGKVEVATEPGNGTRIILKIPLTLAIIDGVTTRVGNTLFAIPLKDIREFQQITPENLTATTSTGEMFRLRDDLIHVIRLRDSFSRIAQGSEAAVKGVFVIVQADSEQAALAVDEIVGYSQIVVKSLPEYMRDVPGLSGCSVLGTGEVSFIVDTNSLLKGKAA